MKIFVGIILAILVIAVSIMGTALVMERNGYAWQCPAQQQPVMLVTQPTVHQANLSQPVPNILTSKIATAACRVARHYVAVSQQSGQYSLPIAVPAQINGGGTTTTVNIRVGGDGDIFFDSNVPFESITAINLP